MQLKLPEPQVRIYGAPDTTVDELIERSNWTKRAGKAVLVRATLNSDGNYSFPPRLDWDAEELDLVASESGGLYGDQMGEATIISGLEGEKLEPLVISNKVGGEHALFAHPAGEGLAVIRVMAFNGHFFLGILEAAAHLRGNLVFFNTESWRTELKSAESFTLPERFKQYTTAVEVAFSKARTPNSRLPMYVDAEVYSCV